MPLGASLSPLSPGMLCDNSWDWHDDNFLVHPTFMYRQHTHHWISVNCRYIVSYQVSVQISNSPHHHLLPILPTFLSSKVSSGGPVYTVLSVYFPSVKSTIQLFFLINKSFAKKRIRLEPLSALYTKGHKHVLHIWDHPAPPSWPRAPVLITTKHLGRFIHALPSTPSHQRCPLRRSKCCSISTTT